MMKELFSMFFSRIDGQDLIRRTDQLCHIEAGQCFRDYHAAADHILSQIHVYHLPNAEKKFYPADGVTVYEDKIMPLAWDVSVGKLTLCDSEHTVAADYTVEPLSLVKGSSATTEGGEYLRIITQRQLLAGEDASKALVILDPETSHNTGTMKSILDLGARGIISDFLTGRYDTPDELEWISGCTEGEHWHVIEGDRDFIGFSVTPRIGDKIRTLVNKDGLKALVECDGHRYKGEFPAVTALLPGRKKAELWVMAHAFEPFLDDDSAGVTAGIELMRQIMRMGTTEYSLRIIFTLELYGFAAFHSNHRGEVIGACNLDALSCLKNTKCALYPPVPGKPFHGVALLDQLYTELHDGMPMQKYGPECFDDMALSDCTTQVPTIWFESKPLPGHTAFWHNTCQRKIGMMDAAQFARSTALATTWAYSVLTEIPETVSVPAIIKPEAPVSPWREYAEQQIFARILPGLPHDLAAVPREFRRSLPERVLYGPFGTLLTRLDGKKSLAAAIQETEGIRGITLSETVLKKYTDALNYLADWGYLEPVRRNVINREKLRRTIAAAGVKPDDLLLVHASVSKCGYIEGGANSLIQTILEVIGPNGTALFTTFTNPYIMLGGVLNRSWNYRPFDPEDLSQIHTGETGRALLRDFPDAIRSIHITHSWAGLGNKARACLDVHGAYDCPAGRNSPMGKALDMGGKILYFGTGIAPTTFLHYLEDASNMPYLDTAVCRVKNPDGRLKTISIEKHLPGHRDFYRSDAENCKFFRQAIASGLEIRSVGLGMGKLQLIDLRQLYEIGMRLLAEDPRVLLCDDPECLFCTGRSK